jgi:hypothetical protein
LGIDEKKALDKKFQPLVTLVVPQTEQATLIIFLAQQFPQKWLPHFVHLKR